MINYYEVLEVSEKASKEVIEKAYKALAKKYHPDLNHDNPQNAESKMKLVNEAFEVLIDENKRANYDSVLEKKRKIEFEKQLSSNNSISNNSDNINNSYNPGPTIKDGNFYINTKNMDEKTKEKLKQKLQERYLDAYDSYLRERGYKIKYKWTFKRFMQTALIIILSIIVFIILFFIPPIHELCIDLYENNFFVKLIVDIVKSFFNAILSIFK